MIFAYARVSTLEQKIDSQINDLKNFGYDELLVDKITGIEFNREGLQSLLGKIRKDDIVVVWRLDRLGRSMLDVLKIAKLFQDKNVHLVSLTDAVDTRTPTGNLMLGLMASFAEYERQLLKERQMAGILSRQQKGLPTGRKKGISSQDKTKATMAQDLYSLEKYSIAKIMELTNIKSRATIYKYLKLSKEELA